MTAATQPKATARCLHCQLIQFVTKRNECRRCHKGLVPEEKPQPSPAPLVLVPAPAKLNIAATIRELRHQRHLSQGDLGRRMCVARTYISKVEADKNTPTVDTLYRFALALQVDISTLLGEPNMRDSFISELAGYVAQLDDEQRSIVINHVRELASAK